MSGSVRGQLAELKDLMATRKQRADRGLDLLLLTVGANIHFRTGRQHRQGADRPHTLTGAAVRFGRVAKKVLERDLPGFFAKLRSALNRRGGNLHRSSTCPTAIRRRRLDTPCPGGRDG